MIRLTTPPLCLSRTIGALMLCKATGAQLAGLEVWREVPFERSERPRKPPAAGGRPASTGPRQLCVGEPVPHSAFAGNEHASRHGCNHHGGLALSLDQRNLKVFCNRRQHRRSGQSKSARRSRQRRGGSPRRKMQLRGSFTEMIVQRALPSRSGCPRRRQF